MFGKNKDKEELLYDTLSITMELEALDLDEDKKIPNDNKKKNKKIFVILFLVIILILLIPLTFLLGKSYEAKESANKALISDDTINITISDLISFKPMNKEATQGLILFQGAKVDAKAYSKLAREISKRGYQVILVDSPFDIPIFSVNKIDDIIKSNPNIKSWIVGGHSLGGVVASSNIILENNQIEGLLLLASYPSNSCILNSQKEVLSIWGSKDGVMNFESFVKAKSKLPKDTRYVEIEGSNHSQFGDYGLQENDNESTVDDDVVLDIVVNNIIKLFNDINTQG